MRATVAAATAIGFGDRPLGSGADRRPQLEACRPGNHVAIADIVVVKWQLEVKGCRWHRKGHKEWLGLPAREWTDKDGNRQFADVIGFVNHGTARRFREAALAAIKAAAGCDGADPP